MIITLILLPNVYTTKPVPVQHENFCMTVWLNVKRSEILLVSAKVRQTSVIELRIQEKPELQDLPQNQNQQPGKYP